MANLLAKIDLCWKVSWKKASLHQPECWAGEKSWEQLTLQTFYWNAERKVGVVEWRYCTVLSENKCLVAKKTGGRKGVQDNLEKQKRCKRLIIQITHYCRNHIKVVIVDLKLLLNDGVRDQFAAQQGNHRLRSIIPRDTLSLSSSRWGGNLFFQSLIFLVGGYVLQVIASGNAFLNGHGKNKCVFWQVAEKVILCISWMEDRHAWVTQKKT